MSPFNTKPAASGERIIMVLPPPSADGRLSMQAEQGASALLREKFVPVLGSNGFATAECQVSAATIVEDFLYSCCQMSAGFIGIRCGGDHRNARHGKHGLPHDGSLRGCLFVLFDPMEETGPAHQCPTAKVNRRYRRTSRHPAGQRFGYMRFRAMEQLRDLGHCQEIKFRDIRRHDVSLP